MRYQTKQKLISEQINIKTHNYIKQNEILDKVNYFEANINVNQRNIKLSLEGKPK